MEIPSTFAFFPPGFPSMSVSYKRSTDFFYSGHVGVLTFLSLENFEHKRKIAGYFAIFSIFYVFVILAILRSHYTIDLFAGIIMGHYIWMVIERPAKWLDRHLGY